MNILNAEQRDETIKVKQLRQKGFVPGVLYGKHLEESLMLQFPKVYVRRFLKTNPAGSTVDLVIGEKKYKALLKEITFHPVTESLEHLSFQTLIADEKITSTAPIILLNKETIEDTIRQSLFELTYRAFPADLFEKIEIDMTGRQTDDILRVGDLDVMNNKEIEIKNLPEVIVFSIMAQNAAVEAVATEETPSA